MILNFAAKHLKIYPPPQHVCATWLAAGGLGRPYNQIMREGYSRPTTSACKAFVEKEFTRWKHLPRAFPLI